jgi:hypothetical protein
MAPVMVSQRLRARPRLWAACAQAVLVLPVVKLMLWTRGYSKTSNWLASHVAPTPEPPAGPDAQIPATVAAISAGVTAIAGMHPLRTACLARSLSIWWMCRRAGFGVTLVMGVAEPVDGRLAAHAWIEYDGAPVNDTQDVHTRYHALPPAGPVST